MTVTYTNGLVFDGTQILKGHSVIVENNVVTEVSPAGNTSGSVVDLAGDILSPGYVDLQVNGGGGVMLNDSPTVKTIERIASAHQSLGATTVLPTLITDSAQATRAAIEAAVEACEKGVHGVGGLHLEGPHLSISRKGAHDPQFIRVMSDDDLTLLLDAADRLPVLLVTVATENVTIDQVNALAKAGVLVSLGHSDANFDTAMKYQKAGASCVTHLFNAMSQLGNREPGLVGAALSNGGLSAGLIADGVHVHPETIRAAFQANTGPGEIFLVSDAMAVAASNETEFELHGRKIRRADKRLTLEDGTLAGADLDLTTAIRFLVEVVELDLATALRAATFTPARLAKMPATKGQIKVGKAPDLIRISVDLEFCSPI